MWYFSFNDFHYNLTICILVNGCNKNYNVEIIFRFRCSTIIISYIIVLVQVLEKDKSLNLREKSSRPV